MDLTMMEGSPVMQEEFLAMQEKGECEKNGNGYVMVVVNGGRR